MSVCNECPFGAVLQSSEHLVNTLNPNDAQRALGAIALTRRCLEGVAEKINCEKPFQNTTTGQLDCPLRDSAYTVRSMAFSPWNPANYTIALEGQAPLGGQNSNHNTGQYL